jgi:hypothetical protein
MAFTEQTVAEIVRQRLGDVDAANTARVIWAIPQALDRLARKVAQNPKKRALLLTSRETTVAELGEYGETDLAEFLADSDNPQILVEYLHHGSIWHTRTPEEISAYPLQKIDASKINLPRMFGDDYLHYWLDGLILRTLNLTGESESLTGDLLLAVPFRPTMAELADVTELHDDFIEKVIEILTNPANDYAEDGEK